ncbi:hypothetical protein EON67_05800 [archaeon]|nr:MAG: hypothetical protein EON67_05800 [archaeon]
MCISACARVRACVGLGVLQNAAGVRSLCSGHGICEFDAMVGNSRCFCNTGFEGDDCSSVSSGPAPKGLSGTGVVLIIVSIILATVLAFLYVRSPTRATRTRATAGAHASCLPLPLRGHVQSVHLVL